jgi:hypothetical protein
MMSSSCADWPMALVNMMMELKLIFFKQQEAATIKKPSSRMWLKNLQIHDFAVQVVTIKHSLQP